MVLAGEAYLTSLPRLHRQLVPLYSLIVLTKPLDPAQWAEIGWEGRETLARLRTLYPDTTAAQHAEASLRGSRM